MEPVRHRIAWGSGGAALAVFAVALVVLLPTILVVALASDRLPALLAFVVGLAVLGAYFGGLVWALRRFARRHGDYVVSDEGVRAEVERPDGRRETAWTLRWEEVAQYALAEDAPPQPSGLELRTEAGREGRWVRPGAKEEERASFERFVDAFLARAAAPRPDGAEAASPAIPQAPPHPPGWASRIGAVLAVAFFLFVVVLMALAPPERHTFGNWVRVLIVAGFALPFAFGVLGRLRASRRGDGLNQTFS